MFPRAIREPCSTSLEALEKHGIVEVAWKVGELASLAMAFKPCKTLGTPVVSFALRHSELHILFSLFLEPIGWPYWPLEMLAPSALSCATKVHVAQSADREVMVVTTGSISLVIHIGFPHRCFDISAFHMPITLYFIDVLLQFRGCFCWFLVRFGKSQSPYSTMRIHTKRCWYHATSQSASIHVQTIK